MFGDALVAVFQLAAGLPDGAAQLDMGLQTARKARDVAMDDSVRGVGSAVGRLLPGPSRQYGTPFEPDVAENWDA